MSQERSRLLHSRYNPEAEAERYVASLSLNENIEFFILVEPGLGYMAAPLKKRNPKAKIISLHAEEHGRSEDIDSQWYPETGKSVQDFLEKEIPDSEALCVKLVEWRPALAVYGQRYLALVEEAAAFIRRSDANARTMKAFGPRWFRNFFTNLELVKKTIYPVPPNFAPISLPVLVTGAGPGLEDSLPLIKNAGNRIFILASSSSAAALEAGGLIPDMVISTDGSQWAKLHLYEVCRGEGRRRYTRRYTRRYSRRGRRCLLAAATTAALPSQAEDMPVLLISDGSLWQTLILNGLNIPFVALPQRGTVTAAALDLAFTLTEGDVYIAGIDLANRGIRTHSRPYSFDRLIEEKAGRVNPSYSQSYKRSSLLKAGGSYGVYASWFEKQLASYPKRLHSLGKNNPLFASLDSSNPFVMDPGAENRGSPKKGPNKESFGQKLFNSRVICSDTREAGRRAFLILENALKEPIISNLLEEELKSLFFAGRNSANGKNELNELIDAMHSSARFGQSGAHSGSENG